MLTTQYLVLSKLDLTTVDDVPMKGQFTYSRVMKVIDGDTIRVAILINSYPLAVDVRVIGVDCPESLKRNASCQLEMDAGLAIKNHIKEILDDKIVETILYKKDKYCRYCGDIKLVSGELLSKYLTSNGYGK